MQFRRKRNIGIWTCALLTMLCMVFAIMGLTPVNTLAYAETVQKETGRYVEIESTETTDTTIFTKNGYQILPAAYSETAQARAYVMHVPEDMEGTATITSTSATATSVIMRYRYDRDLRFRVIHYKANENVNRVVYPLNGGWQRYGYSSATYFMDENGLQSIQVEAGDKLYFVMLAFGTGGMRETYLTLSLNITYGDATSVWYNKNGTNTCAHTGVSAADATETTDAFYGGTYTYGELLTYELATVTDLVSESVGMTQTEFDAEFNTQPAGWCPAPAYETENDVPYVKGADAWSVFEYETPLTDYRVDLAFRWNGTADNDFGIYFNNDKKYSETKNDQTTGGHLLHFYQKSAVLYNSTAIASSGGWWGAYDRMVVRELTDYHDSEWHTVSINVWQNKYFITIDGQFLAEDVLQFWENGVSDSHYSNHVYTADAAQNGYLYFVGTSFDIGRFDITWFDYSDSVADAQFAALQSVYGTMDLLDETKYDERGWAAVETTLENGVAAIFNAADADTVNALAVSICEDLKALPFKYNDVLLGYQITGTGYDGLYSADTDLTDENIETATPVYTKLEMKLGASIRLSEPTGMRFTMMMETSYLDALKATGASYSFGMLIAHADDVMTDGVADYSLLTTDAEITKLNIPAQVSVVDGEYTLFNGVLVEIKSHHYDWDFMGRGYLTVTYADGTQTTIYAVENENVRSVKQVALKAYNDLQAEQDDKYEYLCEYGYSPYTEEQRKVLELFINNGEEFGEVKTNADVGRTTVNVLDVCNVPEDNLFGAALSVLIQHNDQVILIDGGFDKENSKARVIAYLQEQGIGRIDHMILTHSHGDHAGGLPTIMQEFDVGTVYLKPVDWSLTNQDSSHYDNVYNAAVEKINSNGIMVDIVEPMEEGQRVYLDETTYFEFYNCTTLFENQVSGRDYNHYSQQILFVSDTAKAHIGGDATTLSDDHVIGSVGKVDVYVMQHHGDQTYYSSEALLAELQPTYSIAAGNIEVPRATSREICEKYGQVMNVGTDGTLVFDKENGKFVLRDRGEAYLADAQAVDIVSTPIPSTSGATSLSTTDGNKLGQYGLRITGGATTSTAAVLTVPDSFQSTATLTFTDSLIYNASGAGTAVRFRIVLNNKVAYPSDGGWVDLTNADTDNRHYIDLRLKVEAGDKLYFIVDGEATVYATMGMWIDGLWFDLTNVDHLSSDNDEEAATKNFFNGTLYKGSTYTRAELISYEQVVVTDIIKEETTGN